MSNGFGCGGSEEREGYVGYADKSILWDPVPSLGLACRGEFRKPINQSKAMF